MRVLRTMNTLSEHRRPTYLGPNINESTSYQRRGAMTLEKVNKINFCFFLP